VKICVICGEKIEKSVVSNQQDDLGFSLGIWGLRLGAWNLILIGTRMALKIRIYADYL
jgi:hypothetical protein